MKFFAVILLAAIIAYVSADGTTGKRRLVLQSGPGELIEYDQPQNALQEVTDPSIHLKVFLGPCGIKILGDVVCFMKCFAKAHPGGSCENGKCYCMQFKE